VSPTVSITDEILARELGGGAFLGMVLKRHTRMSEVRTSSRDNELVIRRRRIQELRRGARTLEPVPRGHLVTNSPSSEHVVFRPDARARFVVRLERECTRVIRDELAFMAPHRVETGGLLLSMNPNRTMSALVTHASGPARNSKHGHDSVTLGRAGDIGNELGEYMQHLTHVGIWHSHPSHNAQPSRADMDTWAHQLKASGRSRYVGVIATPSRDGSGPQLHAWVCRTDGPGRPCVVEPAELDHY
jgi:Prokaryotic homologs of the JAB domain